MGEMTPQQREQRIQETMEATGVTRAEAEFILAQELGEIDGDVVIVPDEELPGNA